MLSISLKAVANDILKSEINNDPSGSRHLFMNNRYRLDQKTNVVENMPEENNFGYMCLCKL